MKNRLAAWAIPPRFAETLGGRRFAAMAATAAASLLGIAGLAAALIIGEIRTSAQREVAEHWYFHAQEVLTVTQATLSTLQDAETGEHGFLLTGRPDYLVPYDRARQQTATVLGRLAALTMDDPAQRGRVLRLRQLKEKVFSVIDATVDAARAGRADKALAMVLSGQSKSAMDEVRTIIATMQQEERHLLEVHHAALDAAVARYRQITVLFFALGAILLAVAGAALAAVVVLVGRAQLAEGERRLRALADNIPQLAWMARADGWVFWYNKRWYEFTGTTLEQMQGWGWRSIHHPDHVERVVQHIRQAWDSGEPWEDTFPLRGQEGSYRWFLSRAQPILDAKGRVVQWFGTNTDITEQRDQAAALLQAKEEAERLKGEAERANADKSRFLAAASHDLRQPVQALMLFTSILSERLHGHSALQVVDRMRSALAALQMLLDGLLDISRLDAGVIVPDARPIALGELMRRLHDEYLTRAEEKGLELRCVPSSGRVFSDPFLLERILRNLLDNAVRYTRRGRVLLGCRRRGGELVLQVIDTGIGIAPEHREAIFQEFYQVGNPERDRAKGLGLGLSIIRRLCRLLGHRLSLASIVGRGTCFSLHLALAECPEKPAATAPSDPPTQIAGRTEARRVLVIDDEAMIRGGLALLLESWGWTVASATDAEEACAWAAKAEHLPDVILADYRLRDGRTGTEAVKDVLSACGRSIPALIITGDTSAERLAEIEASGFRVIHKPLAADRLHDLMAELLSAA